MNECKCCKKHVPLPVIFISLNIDDEVIYLCPTTYKNIMNLLRISEDGKLPLGSIRKHYSRYVQHIVERMLAKH